MLAATRGSDAMPVLDLIWTMLMWFLFFAWVIALGFVLADVFRSDDLSGVAKAGWTLFVVFIPWLGLIVYLIARGESMTHRYAAAMARKSRDSRVFQRKTANFAGSDAISGVNPYGRSSLTGGMDYDTAQARVVR